MRRNQSHTVCDAIILQQEKKGSRQNVARWGRLMAANIVLQSPRSPHAIPGPAHTHTHSYLVDDARTDSDPVTFSTARTHTFNLLAVVAVVVRSSVAMFGSMALRAPLTVDAPCNAKNDGAGSSDAAPAAVARPPRRRLACRAPPGGAAQVQVTRAEVTEVTRAAQVQAAAAGETLPEVTDEVGPADADGGPGGQEQGQGQGQGQR